MRGEADRATDMKFEKSGGQAHNRTMQSNKVNVLNQRRKRVRTAITFRVVGGCWPKRKIRGVKIDVHPHLLVTPSYLDLIRMKRLISFLNDIQTANLAWGLNRRIERGGGGQPSDEDDDRNVAFESTKANQVRG